MKTVQQYECSTYFMHLLASEAFHICMKTYQYFTAYGQNKRDIHSRVTHLKLEASRP